MSEVKELIFTEKEMNTVRATDAPESYHES